MTVPNTLPINEYVANGSNKDFPYTFRITSSNHLHVYVNNVLQSNGYAVLKDTLNSGTVKFNTAPANGAIVKLKRKVPVERDYDYINGGDLDAEVLDADLDNVVMMIQDLTITTEGVINDAQGERIINVADPLVSTDAATKEYVDNAVTAAGGIPTPGTGDSGKVLTAASGTYSWVALPTINAITGADNIGTGVSVYSNTTSNRLKFKKITPGTNVSISETSDTITINASGGGGGTSGRYTTVTTDFGAVGDGTTNDSAAFTSAHATTTPGWPIYVPAGTYNLGGSTITATGRRWILEGTVSFTNGSIKESMFERQNSSLGTIDVHYEPGGSMYEQRTPFRLGGQYVTPALSIGSADSNQSSKGTIVYADGHSNFLAVKPEEINNPIELNMYSYCPSGRANGVVGTNRLIRNTSSFAPSMAFQSEWVGKALYFNGVKYKVLSYVSANEVTLINYNGSAVSFTTNAEGTYHFTYTIFRGKCNTNGTLVTQVSGHKFFGYLSNVFPSSVIVINGTQYAVSSVSSTTSLTLTTSAGVQTNVDFVGYAEIDGETSAIRMNHSITGEQLTLMTSAGALDGRGSAYLIKTDKGAGDWRPIVVQNGGQDGLSVTYNAAANKTYVGIGDNLRNPTSQLQVGGQTRIENVAIRNNAIEEFGSNAEATLALNYYGYNNTFDHFRNTEVFNGKGERIAKFNGSTKVVDFVNTPTINGVPISGGGGSTQFVDITTYGAVGDFVPGPAGTGTVTTDSASAINTAIATGKPLYIPAGNFWIGDWPTRYAYSQCSSIGPGKVWGDTGRGKQILGKTLFLGATNTHEISYAGGVKWAPDGTYNGIRQWTGHHNWMVLQPDAGPMQFQLYPGGKGQAITASCEYPNKLNAVYGTFDTANLRSGMHIGWYGAVYKVVSVISATQITVTTFAGATPNWTTNTTQRPLYWYYEYSSFVGNVSGTTVTRVSGDALPYGVSGDHMFCVINGTKYNVTNAPETTGSPHTLYLSSSPGTLTNATCEFFRCYGPFAYVTLFRLQGVGGGVETNGGMALNIKNELRIWNGGTSDEIFGDIKLNAPNVAIGPGNGENNLGERLEVEVDGVRLGGSRANASSINMVKVYGGGTGYLPVVAARGAQSNQGLGFDLQGTGKFGFTSGTYARTNFEIYCPSESNTWGTLTSATGKAIFSVNSGTSNGDIEISPGGSGKTNIRRIPAVMLQRTGALSLTNNAETMIPFDTEIADPLGMHAPSDTKIYAPVAGIYQISFNAGLNATGYTNNKVITGAYIYKNGVITKNSGFIPQYMPSGTSGPCSVQWSTTIQLNANDYIEMSVYQGSNGTASIETSWNYNSFSMHLVSGT